ncbi:MAG: phosphate propanoyltransferase [Clostridiales bacterium]|nr:phosphate propanoyltransferase [Clostridiales bacterium]
MMFDESDIEKVAETIAVSIRCIQETEKGQTEKSQIRENKIEKSQTGNHWTKNNKTESDAAKLMEPGKDMNRTDINGKEASDDKPENMTHLSADKLVLKNHPVIAFRGEIDALEAEIILVQHQVNALGMLSLERDLEEIRIFVHSLIRLEIMQEPVKTGILCGMSDEQIHAYSHHPGKYFGIQHFVPSKEQGVVSAYLNKLRTASRQAELSACRAFLRMDLIHALNRLSSLFHVMMIKYLHGDYPASMVEVEASGRHIHLCEEDVRRLFGEGYELHKVRDLSQPGQFVCSERVSIYGPKGVIENVVILGPKRKESQVEISKTDARMLGIEPVVRQSGHISQTPGCILKNGNREVTLTEGVIVAARHIHMHPDDAMRMGINDGDFVKLKIPGERGLVFDHVLARVSQSFATYAHIDYDEANACGLDGKNQGMIIKEGQR